MDSTLVMDMDDLEPEASSNTTRLQLRVVHPGGPTSTLRQGDVYALRPGENTVGRSSACHVHLPYAFVSKLHARLHVGDEEVRLHAEGSNGTSLVVNGLVTAVKASASVVVYPGTIIRLADVELRVERDEEPTTPEIKVPPASTTGPSTNYGATLAGEGDGELPTFQVPRQPVRPGMVTFDEPTQPVDDDLSPALASSSRAIVAGHSGLDTATLPIAEPEAAAAHEPTLADPADQPTQALVDEDVAAGARTLPIPMTATVPLGTTSPVKLRPTPNHSRDEMMAGTLPLGAAEEDAPPVAPARMPPAPAPQVPQAPQARYRPAPEPLQPLGLDIDLSSHSESGSDEPEQAPAPAAPEPRSGGGDLLDLLNQPTVPETGANESSEDPPTQVEEEEDEAAALNETRLDAALRAPSPPPSPKAASPRAPAKGEPKPAGSESDEPSSGGEPVVAEDLDAMTLVELKELCGQRGLKKTGKKAELIASLRQSAGNSSGGGSAAPQASVSHYDSMKLIDLKRELEQRRLSSMGKRHELVERLVAADRKTVKRAEPLQQLLDPRSPQRAAIDSPEPELMEDVELFDGDDNAAPSPASAPSASAQVASKAVPLPAASASDGPTAASPSTTVSRAKSSTLRIESEEDEEDVERDFEAWTVKELKGKLTSLGLSVAGNKSALVERLRSSSASSGGGAAAVDNQDHEEEAVRSKKRDAPDDQVAVESLSVAELREELRVRGLPLTGNKAALVARLHSARSGGVVAKAEPPPAVAPDAKRARHVDAADDDATSARGYWYWAADDRNGGKQNRWTLYDDDTCAKLDDARRTQKKRVPVGGGRYVDVPNMTQRITGDATRRRAVTYSASPLADLVRDVGAQSSSSVEDDSNEHAPQRPAATKRHRSSVANKEEEDEEEEKEQDDEQVPAAAAAKKGRRSSSASEQMEKKVDKKRVPSDPKPAPSAAAEPRAKQRRGSSVVDAAAPVAAPAVAANAVVLGHSGLPDDAALAQLERMHKSLGVGLEDEDLVKCTHLVTNGAVVRTVKTLCAINMGCVVVTLDWVKQCLAAGAVVDPGRFLVADKKAETTYGFSLQESLARARQRKIFAGLDFALTDNVKPPPQKLTAIIESGGGKAYRLGARSPTPAVDTLIIAAPEDVELCRRFVKAGYANHIYTTEAILTSVLRQALDRDQFVLLERAPPREGSDEF